MYYNFSLCDNLKAYDQELKFLDTMLHDYKELNILSAKSMSFGFALSLDRQINCFFDDDDYHELWKVFLKNKDRFLKHSLYFKNINQDFLTFCAYNKNKKSQWMKSLTFFIANVYSNNINSSDGPWFNTINDSTLRKHIIDLKTCNLHNINICTGEIDHGIASIYDFPSEDTQLIPGSIVITNKVFNNLHLLFENKLKIYGV